MAFRPDPITKIDLFLFSAHFPPIERHDLIPRVTFEAKFKITIPDSVPTYLLGSKGRHVLIIMLAQEDTIRMYQLSNSEMFLVRALKNPITNPVLWCVTIFGWVHGGYDILWPAYGGQCGLDRAARCFSSFNEDKGVLKTQYHDV